MFFKYFYCGLIILCISSGCLCIPCDSLVWMDNLGDGVYVSKSPLNLNWYEAFCCCRSEHKTLVSLPHSIRLRQIKDLLYSQKKLYSSWFDGYVSGEKWRHAVTGDDFPSESHLLRGGLLFPRKNYCTVLDTHSGLLKSSPCDAEQVQYLLCDKIKSGDCYPTATSLDHEQWNECDKNLVLQYIKENSCPPRAVTTPAPTTTTTELSKVCYECSEIECGPQ